jgi:hypothetical protein
MLDWREVDFFRIRDGLTPSDTTEAEIAYDFELTREYPPLIERILACPDRTEIARAHLASVPYLACWAPSLRSAFVTSPEFAPLIPTACLLAPWFPATWLYGSRVDRQNLVKELTKAYAHIRPLRLGPYPLDPAYEKALMRSIADNTSQGHRYEVFTLVIDEMEPFETTASRLIQARKDLGHKPMPRGAHHRKDRGAVTALHRLACYRLSKIPINERDLITETLDFLHVKNVGKKIADAKRQVLIDLRNRRYFQPVTGG